MCYNYDNFLCVIFFLEDPLQNRFIETGVRLFNILFYSVYYYFRGFAASRRVGTWVRSIPASTPFSPTSCRLGLQAKPAQSSFAKLKPFSPTSCKLGLQANPVQVKLRKIKTIFANLRQVRVASESSASQVSQN